MTRGVRPAETPACAIALAARVHTTDGRQRDDAEARARLDRAARAFASARPTAQTGPPRMTPEGVLLMALASSAALVDALLSLNASLAQLRPTFCAGAARGAPGVEARLMAEGAAAELALGSLKDTDPRAARVILLAPAPDEALSALADLILEAHRRMTERQRAVVGLVREAGSQEAVAQHLGVTRQAVNQCLGASGWPHLREAERAFRARLSEACRDARSG